MEIKPAKIKCVMYNLNGDKVSENEYYIGSGDTFNVMVPIEDLSTGLSHSVVVARLTIVDNEINDIGLDAFLEDIIPDEDEWDINDAQAG